MKPTTTKEPLRRAEILLCEVPNSKYSSDQLMDMIDRFNCDNQPVLCYFNGDLFCHVTMLVSKLSMHSQGIVALLKVLPTTAAENLLQLHTQFRINPILADDELGLRLDKINFYPI